MFPVERFLWHAAHALIEDAQGNFQNARAHAKEALIASEEGHSGFRYHPKAGLVSSEYDDLKERVLRLSADS
jgi:hypothetical protein